MTRDNLDTQLKGWPKLRELVASIIHPYLPTIGAEIGVSWGWTSEQLLRAFPSLSLMMVDFWDSSPVDSAYSKSGDSMAKLTGDQQAEKMSTAIKRTAFASPRRKVVQSDSVVAANDVVNGCLDFVFIDASHLYENVLADSVAWAPKVRREGLIVYHDIDHPRDKRGLWGVRRAAEQFARDNGLTLEVDSDQTIGWIRTV